LDKKTTEQLYIELMDAREEAGEVPCQNYPDAFFPEHGENGMIHRWAKESCFECPIQKQCLNYALQAHELGIWGGTTLVERAEMRKYLRSA
jgi:hypothetical protein